MNQITHYLFLLLVLSGGVVVSSSKSESAANFLNFFRSTDTVSREALKFLDNVFVEMAKYRCSVGGKDCNALKVY